MILVNNPGSWEHIYAPLDHAAWHGWTFTDLVFPFFLWIVGVAITLSFAKRVERGDDRTKLPSNA
jgi:predicted acyltransferase